MKLTNLIALPIALVADAVSLGQAGITRRIFQSEQDDKFLEAMREINKTKNSEPKP